MATLTLVYDTGGVALSRINNAIAAKYGYQTTIDGQPNPQTKAEFGRLRVGEAIMDIVYSQEREDAARAAADAIVKVVLT